MPTPAPMHWLCHFTSHLQTENNITSVSTALLDRAPDACAAGGFGSAPVIAALRHAVWHEATASLGFRCGRFDAGSLYIHGCIKQQHPCSSSRLQPCSAVCGINSVADNAQRSALHVHLCIRSRPVLRCVSFQVCLHHISNSILISSLRYQRHS